MAERHPTQLGLVLGLQAEPQSPARVIHTRECSQQGSLYAECGRYTKYGIPPKCVDLQSVTCCKASVCPEVCIHLKVCVDPEVCSILQSVHDSLQCEDLQHGIQLRVWSLHNVWWRHLHRTVSWSVA